MATIATLTQKADGNYEGALTTLNITAPIALLPNTRKSKDSAPDYLVVSRKNGFELGAGWNRDLEEHRRGIHLGLALGARVRDHLRQRGPGARRRRDEEGHHLEPRQLTLRQTGLPRGGRFLQP